MSAYWAIAEGRLDAGEFFRMLPKVFPGATTIFFEGTSVQREVKDCYLTHLETGPHLPGRQTIRPKSDTFRCKFSLGICSELETLARRHAVPELCDHVYVYQGTASLLEFPDFCANEIYLPETVPESTVTAIANTFGLKYWKRNDG
jgi:hypothetical protein